MPELTSAEIERLVHKAIHVRDNAYAPHSHFYVGASILVNSGEMFVGCNVENASYSLCQCAERNAASAAVAAGHHDMRAVVVTSIGGVTPCGACRQFLSEFNINMTVIMVDVISRSQKSKKLSQLLPDAFDQSSLPASP
jgi:cytidine deaminase